MLMDKLLLQAVHGERNECNECSRIHQCKNQINLNDNCGFDFIRFAHSTHHERVYILLFLISCVVP